MHRDVEVACQWYFTSMDEARECVDGCIHDDCKLIIRFTDQTFIVIVDGEKIKHFELKANYDKQETSVTQEKKPIIKIPL